MVSHKRYLSILALVYLVFWAVMRSAQQLGTELHAPAEFLSAEFLDHGYHISYRVTAAKVLQMCKLTLEKRSGIADTARLKLEA